MDKANKGCLIMHGLTGTPEIMESIVDVFSDEGFMVSAPLLPGHGTTPKQLAKVRWQEWFEAALQAYCDLASEVKKVCVVGISLGSLLALRLAAEMRMNVRAVATISTPLVLSPFIENVAYPLVKYTPLRWFYRYSKKRWEESVLNDNGRLFYQTTSYDRIPTNAVLEIFKLKKIVRRSLGRVVSPVLAIHAAADKVAPLENIDIIRRGLGSNMVESIVLKNSGHVITLDNDRKTAAEAALAFLSRFS